jgi:hypothetical protein
MKKKTIKGGSVTTDAQKTLKIGKAPTIGGKADMPKLITTRKATSTRAPFANKEKMKAMPKKVSYAGNVVKEIKQTAKSASNAVDKYLNKNRPLPKGMKIGSSNVKKEAGQLAGAVLQGRRYNDKTGKQIMPKTVTAKQKAKLKDASMARKTVKKKMK